MREALIGHLTAGPRRAGRREAGRGRSHGNAGDAAINTSMQSQAMHESSDERASRDARPWSRSEIDSLREGLRAGTPILQIASSLQRNVEAVEAKIAALAAERAAGEGAGSEHE